MVLLANDPMPPAAISAQRLRRLVFVAPSKTAVAAVLQAALVAEGRDALPDQLDLLACAARGDLRWDLTSTLEQLQRAVSLAQALARIEFSTIST